jgi:beta-glucanase (GH16 family)
MSRLFASGTTSWVTPDRMVDPDTPAGVQPAGIASGWELTCSEEFNGVANHFDLDMVRFRQGGPVWACRLMDSHYDFYVGIQNLLENPHTGHPPTEQEIYTQEAIATAGGNLEITARRLPAIPALNPHPQFKYTSGLIALWPSMSQTYGAFEARIACPGGLSQWPAFWQFPETWIGATYYQEHDIMECFESSTTIHINNHDNGPGAGGGSSVSNFPVVVGNTLDFHTYALTWSPTRMDFLVDGVVKVSELNTVAISDNPMFSILNLAMSPRVNEDEYPDRAVLKVDYYRQWQAV